MFLRFPVHDKEPLETFCSFACHAISPRKGFCRSSHPEVFLGKNVQQIYRRTPTAKCDFNKVAKSHFGMSVLL